jgi:hypothetical protein
MTFLTEKFTDAESAVQFLTSNLVKADAANWVVSSHADFTAPALGVRMHWAEDGWHGEQASYRIVRVSHPSGERTTVRTGQSRAMAVAHCEDPSTSGTRGKTRWMDVFYGEDDWVRESASDALKAAGRKARVKWPRYWVNGEPVRAIDLNGPRNDTDGAEGTPEN